MRAKSIKAGENRSFLPTPSFSYENCSTQKTVVKSVMSCPQKLLSKVDSPPTPGGLAVPGVGGTLFYFSLRGETL